MRCVETKRLQLRQWRDNDFDKYAAYYADEINAKYVGGQKNADEAWRSLALQIGHWQLKGFGYWLVNEHQGKGYAFEAALQCKDYARSVLQASSLVSYIAPDNVPSIKLAEKLGAKYENTIELAEHGAHCVYRYF